MCVTAWGWETSCLQLDFSQIWPFPQMGNAAWGAAGLPSYKAELSWAAQALVLGYFHLLWLDLGSLHREEADSEVPFKVGTPFPPTNNSNCFCFHCPHCLDKSHCRNFLEKYSIFRIIFFFGGTVATRTLVLGIANQWQSQLLVGAHVLQAQVSWHM